MFRRLYFPNEANPGGLHFGMFTTAVENLAEPQLKEKWMPKMLTCEILGTYAQTEMGHGILYTVKPVIYGHCFGRLPALRPPYEVNLLCSSLDLMFILPFLCKATCLLQQIFI